MCNCPGICHLVQEANSPDPAHKHLWEPDYSILVVDFVESLFSTISPDLVGSRDSDLAPRKSLVVLYSLESSLVQRSHSLKPGHERV
jgi:hypothetical protein